MKISKTWMLGLVLMLIASGSLFAGKAGRWAGNGAMGGAVLGLVTGHGLGDVVAGAAIGAAGGGIAGSMSEKKDRRQQEEAELAALRQQEAARQQAEAAQPKTSIPADLPQSREEWVQEIGVDNTNALDALVDCQQARARLLAQAGATFDDAEFRLVARWLEALVALDLRDTETSNRLLGELIEMDGDIDTMQQASLLADQALLEIRNTRRTEGISCAR